MERVPDTDEGDEMTTATQTPTLTWDEPTGCTSARGWLFIENGHPDEGHRNFSVLGVRACGWYMDYAADPGRRGKPAVLASAYVHRMNGPVMAYTYLMTGEWFATVDESRAAIEAAVRGYLSGE